MKCRSFAFLLLALMAIIITGSANAQVTITGTLSVCQAQTPFTPGTSTDLTGSPTGGTWSSYDTTVLKVDSSGVVTGYAAGVTNITYTVGGSSTFVSVISYPLP